jgi:hypothetical protein
MAKEMRAATYTKMGEEFWRFLRVLVSSSVRVRVVSRCLRTGQTRDVGMTRLTSPRIESVSVGPEDPALAGLVDGARLLVDDGKLAVNSLKSLLAQLVGLVHVRLGVRVGCLEQALDGLAEAGIGAVDDLDGLLAKWVGLEVVDAAGNGGVRRDL